MQVADVRRRVRRGSGSRRVLAALAFALGCVAAGCEKTPPGPTVPAPGSRPNIVLVVIDTLRADHLGCYGYARSTSPHLDAFARDAIRYTHAFSQAPWTTPSVAALMTSRYPRSLGIHNVQSPVPESVTMLPEMLERVGYRTGAFVSHSFVSRRWGFGRGFQSFDESNVQGHMATTSPGVTDLAISWIDTRLAEESTGVAPFFLFVHYFDPHFGYIDHPEYAFGGRDPGYRGPVHSGVLPGRFADEPGRLDAADLHELERLYDSEIRLTDQSFGRLVDALRERGLYRDALVVVAGDHGEEFLDHGGLDHARTLYDELMKVPLLVKLPGRTGAVVDRPVALIDVVPTIADWLRLAPPEDARGVSLLDESADPTRPIFFETERTSRLQGVRLGHHKLIVDLDTGEAQLFDLASDPREQQDLSGERPGEVEALRQLVTAWSAANESTTGTRLELSNEERERLKALGYLQ